MKRKSPISVERILFYTYNQDETDDLMFINQFRYDERHDFFIDEILGGIAVNVEFSNMRSDKGARRKILYTLVDMTARCETASKRIRLSLAGYDFKESYIHFPAESSSLIAGHTYKLVVYDENASETLAESIVHLLDKSMMGDPAEWYEVCDGGIRPSWRDELFKSLNTIDEKYYYVHFNVTPNMGNRLPAVMPELEIRLHYPDGKYAKAYFKEPFCSSDENYRDRRWSVECPVQTILDINGVFYAELLCMEYPIAGFVFDTSSSRDINGAWFGHELLPLDEYSYSAAMKRINEYIPDRNGSEGDTETDPFDEMLDRFITSEMESLGKEDCLAQDSERGEADEETKEEKADEKAEEKETDFLASLDNLTGLRSVKEKLTIYERVVRFNKMRFEKGLPVSDTPLHAMFLGSPGTGKTTVAKLIGEMLCRAGVLSKGHVVVRERATLLGQNYNSEAEKTLAAIEEAQGGILLIDEAYQLHQPKDPRDPGKFVIETLLTALSDTENRDWMLILAGYPDEMKRMFEMNPGFKSRIPDSNIYTFDDFTEEELMEIAENYFTINSYTLTGEAHEALSARLKADYAQRGKSFGNARHVVNMIQTEILPSMAVRVTDEGLDDETSLTEIQERDIPSPVTQPTTFRPRLGFVP